MSRRALRLVVPDAVRRVPLLLRAGAGGRVAHRRAIAAGGFAAAFAMGVSMLLQVAAAAGGVKATGNAQGLAVLFRVHHAYEHVPAVVASARVNGVSARFTLVLRNGIVVAEEYAAVSPAGTTLLVAGATGPTYARQPGASCWKRLSASNPQTLEDVGLHFPDAYKTVVGQPHRVGLTWLLPMVTEGRFPGERASITLHISARTMFVESQSGLQQGRMVMQLVRSLGATTPLPSHTPVC